MNWFWTILAKLGFSRKKVINRQMLTEQYEKFETYQIEEERRNKSWKAQKILMCKYILDYKKSPFEGDDDLEEAQKILQECGIYIKVTK